MEYRELGLYNATYNTTYTFTNKNHKAFATNLGGFGLSNTNQFVRIGNMNYLAYSQSNLNNISFTVYFYDYGVGQKYAEYYNFLKFLSKGDIYLTYNVPSVGQYRRPVVVISITKTEVDYDTNVLSCDINLDPTSFWEDANESSVTITNNGSATININGNMSVPFTISMSGTLTNPSYSFSMDNEPYGSGAFTGTFDSLVLNTNGIEEEITLTSGGTELENPYSYQNFTTITDGVKFTFFDIEIGTTNVTLSGVSGTTTITWRNRYVSV